MIYKKISKYVGLFIIIFILTLSLTIIEGFADEEKLIGLFYSETIRFKELLKIYFFQGLFVFLFMSITLYFIKYNIYILYLFYLSFLIYTYPVRESLPYIKYIILIGSFSLAIYFNYIFVLSNHRVLRNKKKKMI